jgi:hypothetical protein
MSDQYLSVRRSVPIPVRMSKLPRDHRGFIVPKFVAFIDGKPDFRVIDTPFFVAAVKHDLCWLCGEKLGRYKAYVIGPMCAVNRTTSEPACHRECATYALQVCPFLAQPKMRRNEKNMPENYIEPAGHGLHRNPGMGVLWMQATPARPYEVSGDFINSINGGVLLQLLDPVEVQWWKNGRPATREEAIEALERGAPAIRDIAIAEGNGALDAFEKMYQKALTYLPVHA